ncbi:ABC transporter permease [Edaphobacillus lindanitolerans]|uniref:Transport permease protein n=1 Tax=Edaphobacillus lindanitolerans TaxID=550447 RepID=A0A1U7PI12_9BACI|nr:ABC transporter permease [Edaphobacillus lindanitolerans]SIT70965.1 teichoic acid transport system permease protein [Edaphobacillus lindanitolerans]
MNSLVKLLKEQYQSIYLIQRLALFQLKIDNRNNYLGLVWEVMNPAIQMAMYWFVFGLGLRGNQDVDGVPFVFWMLAGISMWFFMNQGILDGTKSIHQKFNMVAKMNFPLSTLPSYVITGKLYGHLALLGIVMVAFWISGYHPTIYYIQLIYFIGLSYSFAFAITLLTSTLAVVVRDVQMIIQSLLRIMFFLSPILWLPDRLPETMQKFMKFNPFYYLSNGYRAALLYNDWYIIDHWKMTLYNLGLLTFILMLGASAHYKFRDRFSDFI